MKLLVFLHHSIFLLLFSSYCSVLYFAYEENYFDGFQETVNCACLLNMLKHMLLQFMLLSHCSQLLSFQGFSIFLWNAVIQEKLCHCLFQTCELYDKLSTAGIYWKSLQSSFLLQYSHSYKSENKLEKWTLFFNEEVGFYSQIHASISQQNLKAWPDQEVVQLCC